MKQLNNYFKDFNVDSLDELSLEQGKQIFILIIKDFKMGNLSLDELSTFGFMVFHQVAKKHPQSDLFQASLSASELNFAVRSKAVFENLVIYMNSIEAFFEKYKN